MRFLRMPSRPASAAAALPGREHPAYAVPERHEVLDAPLLGPFPEGTEILYLALGCFWGEERLYWRQPGVVGTAVGYMGGFTPNPTYEETCTGMTGHAETVMVAYDPAQVSAEILLTLFWENHDPTQVDRQGNDVGSQYRSMIVWTTPEQRDAALATRQMFTDALSAHGRGGLADIATEIRPYAGQGEDAAAGPFYPAEGYHQQYLEKNPGGYCPNHATGLRCGPEVA